MLYLSHITYECYAKLVDEYIKDNFDISKFKIPFKSYLSNIRESQKQNRRMIMMMDYSDTHYLGFAFVTKGLKKIHDNLLKKFKLISDDSRKLFYELNINIDNFKNNSNSFSQADNELIQQILTDQKAFFDKLKKYEKLEKNKQILRVSKLNFLKDILLENNFKVLPYSFLSSQVLIIPKNDAKDIRKINSNQINIDYAKDQLLFKV